MITSEEDFRRAVSDAIIHAKAAVPEDSAEAFNDAADRIVAAAEEWAPIYMAICEEEAIASGAASCNGLCCEGANR